MARDPELRAHSQWIGLLQPVGLVVSPPALVAAGAQVDSNIKREQDTLQRLIETPEKDGRPFVGDLRRLLVEVLGWQETDLVGGPAHPEQVQRFDVALPDYEETLQATFAVPASKTGDACLMLCMSLPNGTDPDDAKGFADRRWQASAQSRFERLLWENGIPIGLLFNGVDLRLCYVPRGESSGHVTFPIDEMCRVPGRPILGALRMLLGADRVFSLPTKQRLPAILEESRKYQSLVSNALSEQVLAALRELLAGFQAADEYTKGKLLVDVLREAPQEVYGALLATLLRLVFVLYAEDRSLTPDDHVYLRSYGLSRLFERLREDAALYPDTMEQRYGAWAQLLSVFRLIFDGAEYVDADTGKTVLLPPRQGHLFNPDTYPFLEGRPYQTLRVMGDRYIPPRVSDGVVYRVLESLMLLDGQRLSYRSLDVEQIGSVYEGLMGFELQIATGPSIAVKPDHVVVNLKEILEASPADREKLLKEQARCDLTDKAKKTVKEAKTVDELVAALDRKLSPRTPNVIPLGGLYLQPTEERRRSGSHYTPRSLTQPIVQTALRPIFERLGDKPRPEQILELKVCDPAMGSGAFLVEACRQLAEKLVDAWTRHNAMPAVPPDEDPLLHARRAVAQRCLYGVDKNRFAVDLAKLSLWLATLAKDHPFTFVDHALKHGDSLVGLGRKQIAQFHWKQSDIPLTQDVAERFIDQAIRRADTARRRIEALGDEASNLPKHELLKEADDALSQVRLIGDLVIAAFFGADKEKEREKERVRLHDQVELWLRGKGEIGELVGMVEDLWGVERGVNPFHWEIEFPEVFRPNDPGFDVIIGNPPFAGSVSLAKNSRKHYPEFLRHMAPGSTGKCDLVAYFFRASYSRLRERGCQGLIATKTIAQGDTRISGLQQIVANGGDIFSATKRLKWPGKASVVTSVVHISRGKLAGHHTLDGKVVPRITAFLLDRGLSTNPTVLRERASQAFLGSKPGARGFVFENDPHPQANNIELVPDLLKSSPRAHEVLKPYLGGSDLGSSPTQRATRWIINLGEMEEAEARAHEAIFQVVAQKVRPLVSRKRWWQYDRSAKELYASIAVRRPARVLVIAESSDTFALSLKKPGDTFSNTVIVILLEGYSAFAILQSRIHEVWVRVFSSTMKDDLRYVPADCYETFPFPVGWEGDAAEALGKTCHEYRSALMADEETRARFMNGIPPEGLTATYNRFHDPDETLPGIMKLRGFHDQIDRAVLDGYGWTDIRPQCEFILDYEEEEENVEDENNGGHHRRKKKPWRYRWPDEIRDEVLARLLELNAKRAEEERLLGDEAGQGTSAKKKSPKRPAKKKSQVPSGQALLGLADEGEGDE